MDGGELSSRFDIVRELGAGSSGVVFEAVDRESERTVALKVLKSVHPDALYRFKREFRALQGLTHPNLVGLHELGVIDGAWFFTMDLVPGQDFLSFVWRVDPDRLDVWSDDPPTVDLDPRGPRYDEARLRDTFHQLAVALVELHDRGKIHRDLKPSNVLVRADGHLVVVDFGLILDVDEGRAAGDRAGTPAYMAPEQLRGDPIRPASDWYAAGLMLYEAITGRVPFEGRMEVEEARAVDPPPPSTITGVVPRDLDRLCVDLLRADPDLRPCGREVLARLEEPARARRITLPPQLDGRDRELELLDEAVRRCRGGRAAAVCLVGPPDSGKTALLRRASFAALRDPRCRVIHACCHPGEHIPFGGLDAAVDGLSPVLEELSAAELAAIVPPGAGVLTAAFPVLRRVAALAEVTTDERDAADPVRRFRAIVDVLAELLRELARSRTLVFVIDDLDHAEPSALAILRGVIRHRAAPPVAFLLAARDSTQLGLPRRVVRVPMLPPSLDDEEDTFELPLETATAP